MLNKDQLRPWQKEAAQKALQWLLHDKSYKQFLINAAPGSGKTICASHIASLLIEAGEIDRVIVIAPRREVVNQWAGEYKTATDRHMMKITAADSDPEGAGVDLCATWSAVQGLLDAFQNICRNSNTLVICDEHHHAAVEAAWGRGAEGAFADAKYVLVLTGTPIRADGQQTTWFAYDDNGKIDHPEEGTYTLTYGDAVELNYCRPITFHRHEGKFTITLKDSEEVAISGSKEVKLNDSWKKIPGLQQALDYYKLARTPKYLSDEKTPDKNSYQATMIESGIEKLDDLRNRMPKAGGLVIAPSIGVAEYMAKLLEMISGEKPSIVHSNLPNPEGVIDAFRHTDKKWIVTVGMVSEGVDIRRLRVLIYLPNAQTELHFRQSMGRVVRTMGNDDISRAYVVMPTHKIFEEFARRVEREMPSRFREDDSVDKSLKTCPECAARCSRSDKECPDCGYVFPEAKKHFKPCPECEAVNTLSANACVECGTKFGHDFTIELDEALRLGAIVRGEDIDEEEVREGEALYPQLREYTLKSGNAAFLKILQQVPEESLAYFVRVARGDSKK